MTNKQLKDYIRQTKREIDEGMRWEHNELAIDTVLHIYDRILESGLENCWDYVEEEIDDSLIYYVSAWKYLQDSQIVDFEEAIQEGYTTLTGIACYYLRLDVYDILSKFTNFDDLIVDDEEEDE